MVVGNRCCTICPSNGRYSAMGYKLQYVALLKKKFMNLIKHYFVALALAYCALSEGQNQTFQFNITNISAAKGAVFVQLYNSEDSWLQSVFMQKQLDADSTTKSVSFDLPYGTYGIAIYQDVIQNGEPDMNFIGAPKEPVAFGNNYRPFMGEPRLKKAAVVFDQEYKIQTLKLK